MIQVHKMKLIVFVAKHLFIRDTASKAYCSLYIAWIDYSRTNYSISLQKVKIGKTLHITVQTRAMNPDEHFVSAIKHGQMDYCLLRILCCLRLHFSHGIAIQRSLTSTNADWSNLRVVLHINWETSHCRSNCEITELHAHYALLNI